MKKGLLFVLAMFMMVSTIEAKLSQEKGKRVNKTYLFKAKPIVFVEKGIQFSVLPNGKFKFSKLDYKQPRNKNKWKRDRKLKVQRNFKGQIRKVGQVQIYYNRFGNVTQIGSVDLQYKNRKLKKVGHLRLVYKPNGNVKYIGHVKYRDRIYFSRRPITIT
jgi:hypothetical protein